MPTETHSAHDLREFRRTGRWPSDDGPTLAQREKVNRVYAERELQRSAHEFLSALRIPHFHVPNERASEIERMKLAAEGVDPGVPDIVVVLHEGRSGWIELKSESGTLTENQKRWRDLLIERGHQWALCRSLREIEDALREWGRFDG